MDRPASRRTALRAGLALGAALALPSARACEFFSSTMRIVHPWSRASRDGSTSAVVSMKFDDVLQPDRLVRVETPVAEGAEMGGAEASPNVDFDIPAGRETMLYEFGTYLRLVRLRHPLEIGRSYPLHLVFEKGGLVQAELNIDYA